MSERFSSDSAGTRHNRLEMSKGLTSTLSSASDSTLADRDGSILGGLAQELKWCYKGPMAPSRFELEEDRDMRTSGRKPLASLVALLD